jgi:hypothetical protein
MKKTIILILSVLLFFGTKAQSIYSDTELKLKCDSILIEGNNLYSYEKAAWITSDLAREKKEIYKNFGGLLTYKRSDTISTLVLSKKGNKCIYEVSFISNYNQPCKEDLTRRELTQTEKKLQETKVKMVDEIFSKDIYQVSCPEGYNFNIQLIPGDLSYKLYFILGTNRSNEIPFGNDYVFFANNEGQITSWRKCHSGLIYTPTEFEGNKVTRSMHSHLKSEPFISATDICTFKLYAELCGLEEFEVYSTGLKKNFKYNLKENKIEFSDL